MKVTFGAETFGFSDWQLTCAFAYISSSIHVYL